MQMCAPVDMFHYIDIMLYISYMHISTISYLLLSTKLQVSETLVLVAFIQLQVLDNEALLRTAVECV